MDQIVAAAAYTLLHNDAAAIHILPHGEAVAIHILLHGETAATILPQAPSCIFDRLCAMRQGACKIFAPADRRHGISWDKSSEHSIT
jgi:hypothetical protein